MLKSFLLDMDWKILRPTSGLEKIIYVVIFVDVKINFVCIMCNQGRTL